MNEKITIQTLINADTTQVWNYYTQAEHITQWNFATSEWHCPNASADLRKGGKHFARMEAKDGSWGFDFEAIYEEVVSGQKLSYVMADGRQAEVDFLPSENATKLIIRFDPDLANPTDLQKQGWQAILENFRKYVESK